MSKSIKEDKQWDDLMSGICIIDFPDSLLPLRLDKISVLESETEINELKFKKLSGLLGMKIECENQKELALMGAEKRIVEANQIPHEHYRLSLDFKGHIKS